MIHELDSPFRAAWYFSDNYVSLLPGETLKLAVRDVRLQQPGLARPAEIEATGPRIARVTLRI